MSDATTLVAAVRNRLEAGIEALSKRVEEAADLTEMVRKGAIPNVTPWAYVIPLGLQARSDGDAGTGFFTQMLDEVVGVILVVRSAGDRTGGKALPTLDELIQAAIALIPGWGPASAIGVFRVRRGALLSVNAGVAIYQLDFAIQTQVRTFHAEE